jgi:hypothetical protein
MFLQMEQLPGVDNLRNYPAENIRELEELLLSGGPALPDPKREGFYDLENHRRTFFIQISSITGRVALLATWIRSECAVELTDCATAGMDCTT